MEDDDAHDTIGACLVPIISKLQDIFSSIGQSPIDLPQVSSRYAHVVSRYAPPCTPPSLQIPKYYPIQMPIGRYFAADCGHRGPIFRKELCAGKHCLPVSALSKLHFS